MRWLKILVLQTSSLYAWQTPGGWAVLNKKCFLLRDCWHTSFKAHFLHRKYCKQEFGSANLHLLMSRLYLSVETVSLYVAYLEKFLAHIDGCWCKYKGFNSFHRYLRHHYLFEPGFKIALESHRAEITSWLYHQV